MKTEYKKTKLGLIPEDWELVKLGDVVNKISSGKTKTKSAEGKYPVYGSTGEIGKIGSSDYSGKRILVARVGANAGTLYQVDGSYGVSDNTLIVDVKPAAEINYVYNLLIKLRLTQMAFGSGQPLITGGQLKSLKIPLPPLPEQVRIADCLSQWDRGIALLERLIAQKEEQKKGLMQQLLTGRQRLPGFAGEWERVKLGDVTKRVKRKNTELNDNVITISAQRGFVRQEDFFSKRVASSTLSNYYLLHKGEFAYNKSYSKGYPMGAFKRLDDFDKAVVTTLYICFKCKEHVDSDFMQQFFEGGMMIKGLMRVAQEGGRAHGLLNISLTDFFDLPLSLPPLPEQKAIAAVLNTADRELSLLGAKLGQYRLQKRGLMQQLLTGRKRLV
ncbi:restriction endonuclease subunit S [Saprospira grandis]|uniref:Type I restriction-modification system, S subunit n=1 Tax=Saprospira grandis (strain Lewin) TaxID=984262 RepID=H6L718_SAPGL|nr:restriction endonuclease subunit S [Saprospira grandis]AFC26609.1 type I restriction-modification system, S subunit [Saprospira grandis str. Lewin]